jgi:hypothetical protein
MTSPNVKIGRYEPRDTMTHEQEASGIRVFTGWIEPADRSWIVYLGQDGVPALYWGEREESGAVVGDPVVLDNVTSHENERLIVDAAAGLGA